MSSHVGLRSIARVLILVGGVVLILGAILQIVDLRSFLDLTPNVRSLGPLTGSIIWIIVGVFALIGASQVSSPVWTIILMVLGYLVGGLGGILIFIGALIGLVVALVKS
jgi:chemotaxis signal transduction protein